MFHTWRWFGPKDGVSLSDIRQAGATGIVTALHDLQPGEIWHRKDICARRIQIEESDLEWSVVESLGISENIKSGSDLVSEHIKNYIESLHNLAAEGINTVCYNFMPILDWTRTQLRSPQPDGALAMRFDLIDFAIFDIHILGRQGAEKSFPAELQIEAKKRFDLMKTAAITELGLCIIAGLPGSTTSNTLASLREEISAYKYVDEIQLRRNLHQFLEAIIPEAQALGIRMCCHPDDPPFSLLGLPRIVSTEADLLDLVNAANQSANGITLCSGSLGVRGDNDCPGIMKRLGRHVHFLHLRNTRRENIWGDKVSFFEDQHLGGNTDMPALIDAILTEENRRSQEGRIDSQIPMRPDHGQEILTDIAHNLQPGYPAVGRLKGLAEIRGVEVALNYANESRPDA